MSIDLIIQCGTKFALHQWLDARGLGQNVQDTDPESPTFGEYKYTHKVGKFNYWNEPSGVVTKSIDTTDPENPVATQFSGFYALLKFKSEIPANLRSWAETSTATSVLDGVSGVGGEGITILNPEDLRAQVVAGGAPLWDGLMGVGSEWSDPALWAFQNVMAGDQRDFGGETYESLRDFNVHSPSAYPQGWELVDAPTGNEWQAGIDVQTGEQYTWGGKTYKVVSPHTTQDAYRPDKPGLAALWKEVAG